MLNKSSMELIFNETITRDFSTTPLVIDGLDGDRYNYVFSVFQYGDSGDLYLSVNEDYGVSNYLRQEMKGEDSTASARVSDGSDNLILTRKHQLDYPSLAFVFIDGKSGTEFSIDGIHSYTSNSNKAVFKSGSFYKNTAIKLESINIFSLSSFNSTISLKLYRIPKNAHLPNHELIDLFSDTARDLNANPYSITGLDGNSDLGYLQRLVNNENTKSELAVRLNDDSTANIYVNQYLYNNGGTISSVNSDDNSARISASGTLNLESAFFATNAKSGNKRLISSSFSNNYTNGMEQTEAVSWYNNTASNVTQLDTVKLVGSTTDITQHTYRNAGDHIAGYPLFEMLPWETVERLEVNGDFSAGHTFDVDGDAWEMIRIKGYFNQVNGTISAILNNDSGSNYYQQYLRSNGSSTTAGSSTQSAFVLGWSDSSEQAMFDFILFSKSGNNRVAFTNVFGGANLIREFRYESWNNSASNIDEIKLFNSSSDSVTGNFEIQRLAIK